MIEKPRKFRISIAERIIVDGKEAHGKGYAKTIDFNDAKPIFDLLKAAVCYSEKYGQNVKIHSKGLIM